MTVDELISALQELKELHPMAGNLQVIKEIDRYDYSLTKVKYSVYGMPVIEGMRLKFEDLC